MDIEISPSYDDKIVIEFIQLDGGFMISEQFNAYMKQTPCTDYMIDVDWGIQSFAGHDGYMHNRPTGNSTVTFKFHHQDRPFIEAGIKAIYDIEVRQVNLDAYVSTRKD